jgi:L-cysteine:1D-myo-inositol 2-amino-2-deoxy-alpha-D-glucopyranoside ligase
VTGQPLARHWMHAGMVGLDGEKMSKSLGNLVFVEDLLEKCEPAVARLALLSHHYREDWEWHEEEVDLAADRLESWRSAASLAGGTDATESALLESVRGHLDDDLDTPGALAVMDEAASDSRRGDAAAQLIDSAELLGVPLS